MLDLTGFYGDFAIFDFDVDVTNLENGDTVIFSGIHIGTLTLEHVSGAGTFNLVMAQDPCVENFFGRAGNSFYRGPGHERQERF